MKFSILATILLVTFVSTFPNSLQTKDLPSRARWVIHFDIEKFSKSILGESVFNNLSGNSKDNFLFEVLKKMNSITIYSDNPKKGSALFFLRGPEESIKNLYALKSIGFLGDHSKSKIIQLEGFDVYRTKKDGVFNFLFSTGDKLILTEDINLMRYQLKALKKSTKTLDSYKSLKIESILDSMIMFYYKGPIILTKSDPEFDKVFSLIDFAKGDLKTIGEKYELKIEVKAKTKTHFRKIKDFLDGIISMIKLENKHGASLKKMVESIKTENIKNNLFIKLKYNTSDFASIVRDLMK